MGVFDSFVDGGKCVQLKLFPYSYEWYGVGDKVPKKRVRDDPVYPKSYQAYCFASPGLFVTVKNHTFVGISDKRDRRLPLFRCDGKRVRSPAEWKMTKDEKLEKLFGLKVRKKK